MKPETESALRLFAGEARKILLEEVEDRLHRTFGMLPDGRLPPVEACPEVVSGREFAETRRRLEETPDGFRRAGLTALEACGKLARDEAFALLLGFAISRITGVRTRGFEIPTPTPTGPPFPTTDVHGEIVPSQPGPETRTRLAGLVGALRVEEAFAPGNEETLGWLHQYFNEKEKKEVFESLNRKKRKIHREDIPLATQLFTPGWIVSWIVENSLGRHWLQMHPDSRLAHRLPRIVPLGDGIPRLPLKKLRDVALLDPACGAMHFGLAAFDLFSEMYREEWERAGEAGWPEEPSVSRLADIPASILGNNIHGLDIDPRAVGLARLALRLRAMPEGPGDALPVPHVYRVGELAVTDPEWAQAVDELRRTRPACADALDSFRSGCAALNPGGSLARVENCIPGRIGDGKNTTSRRFKKAPDCPFCPFAPDNPPSDPNTPEERLLDRLPCLSGFRADASSHSNARAEAARGFRILGLLRRRFDVIVTNPPYLARRSMQSPLAEFLRKEYPNGKGDLYTAFIERCTELLAPGGRLGLIVQQSFMFISSYELLRKRLLEGHRVESMCHAGPHAFEAISGEKVNTTLFVLAAHNGVSSAGPAEGVYFRLVKEPDAESKRRRFESALTRIRSGEVDPDVYRCRNGDFDDIPGSPWVYWIPRGLRRLFRELPGFGELAPPRHGLSTCDNFRFVRKWWEVGKGAVQFQCGGTRETLDGCHKWYPYMKGGGSRRWFGNREHVVNWRRDGAEIKADIVARFPYIGGKWGLLVTNPEYYFRRGITWSFLTSGRFSARLSPGGFLFDVAGSSAFPEDIPLGLALLNSSFARYALRLINPTVNFQVGDLVRLPIPATTCGPALRDLVERAVRLARIDSHEDETDWDFIAPPRWPEGVADATRRADRLRRIERRIDEEVYGLYGIESPDREAVEAELQQDLPGRARNGSDERAACPQTRGLPPVEVESLGPEALAQRWISYAAGIALGRFQPGTKGGLGRGRFRPQTVRDLQEQIHPDGVLVMDKEHPADMPARVLRILAGALGEDAASRIVLAATGGDGPPESHLRTYFQRTFFKLHVRRYRKRPVYWFLQSPGKHCGIWVFHERMSGETLSRIRSRYVKPKIERLRHDLAEAEAGMAGSEKTPGREFQKNLAARRAVLRDFLEFDSRLGKLTEGRAYKRHADDGVLLNMTPLQSLIPSREIDLKEAGEALERGEYDWSGQAMDLRRKQVLERCRTDLSCAVAHGLEDEAEAGPAGAQSK